MESWLFTRGLARARALNNALALALTARQKANDEKRAWQLRN